MGKRSSGLTLLEVLVVLVILGIVFAAITASLSSGLFMLKQSEYKARAMSIASAKLQNILSSSYNALETRTGQTTEWNFSDANNSAVTFVCDETVEEFEMGDRSIPYKNVSVNCSFVEKNSDGTPGSNKTVHLTNLVPYPPVHSLSRRYPPPDSSGVLPTLNGDPAPKASSPSQVPGIGEEITSGLTIPDNSSLPLTFNFPVDKKIEIYYNLAVKATNPSSGGINQTDLVRTQCYFDGKKQGITTGTPVVTQPFISNALVVDNVTANRDHSITIEWWREPGDWNATVKNQGEVTLREYDIFVLAYEKKD